LAAPWAISENGETKWQQESKESEKGTEKATKLEPTKPLALKKLEASMPLAYSKIKVSYNP
jgi:hypothetical protein